MKLTYAIAAIPAIASVADARYVYTSAFAQPGCAPCAATSNTRSPSALEMRRRRSPSSMMGSLLGTRSVFEEMEQMQREMDRQFSQFDNFFDSPMLMRPSTPFLTRRSELMLPELAVARPRPYRYNIHEDDDKFTLAVELPGVQASDMKVSLEQDGRVLRLSGVRTTKNGEMSYESKFEKAFVLDKTVDVEAINAKLNDGVMTIEAPKKPKEEPKTVEIPIIDETPHQLEAAKEEEAVPGESTDQVEEEKVEMKVDEPTPAESEEDVVDLDSTVAEDKPTEMAKAPEDDAAEEPKKDDLMEDGEILI